MNTSSKGKWSLWVGGEWLRPWWVLSAIACQLFVLALPGCGNGGRDGSRSDHDDEIGTQRQALTGSTVLAAALSGKIVAPENGAVLTGMPGDPTVGDNGAANYRLPIWVPDGINGLRPTLAVEYNSEDGSGVLGPRWKLSGFSTITRCPKTRAQDGRQTAVNFFGSTFCLDGERMIMTAIINSTTTEFRTELDSYAKIVGTKDTTLNQYYQFKVYQKEGLIVSFGSSALSRLHGNPHSWAGGWQADVNYAYYVDKIQDRYGNAINVTYQNGIGSPASGKMEVQELQPATITWGPTSERSVTFAYELLPGGATVNSQLRYVSGLGIGMSTYLTTISIKGPDGVGNTPVLKQYKFTYSTTAAAGGQTIITGDRVLASIKECDGTTPTPRCKRPTTIQWSPGSTEHTDVNLSALGVPYARSLGRILAADLNADGRDDIIYRSSVPPHHTESYPPGHPKEGLSATDCVGWVARLNVGSLGSPSFAGTTPLPLNGNPDPTCLANVISSTEWLRVYGGNAYHGDLVFADLNSDGYPDVLSPIGNGRVPHMVGYRAYLNKAAVAPGTFGAPINFLDSVGQLPSNNAASDGAAVPKFSNPKHAALSVGDLDSDGIPDVVRPNQTPPQTLSAATLTSSLTPKTQTRNGYTFNYLECPTTTPGCNRPIANVLFPDNSTTFRDLTVLDLDGDGTAEILRSATSCGGMPCGSMNGVAAVTSPTINTIIPVPPRAVESYTYDYRTFLDLNGDGLQDLVWQDPNATTTKVFASLNTGQGFGPTKLTTLTGEGTYVNWASSAVAMDYNLDGRQDLLWARTSATASNPLPHMKVLLSDGTGGFSLQMTTIPSTDYFDPYSEPTLAYSALTSVVDLNGDGLPDVLQIDLDKLDLQVGVWYGTHFSEAVAAHVRTGIAPAMVLGINEGNGRTISFTYGASSNNDPSFYSSNRAASCDTDPTRLACLNRGRWLTRSLTISGGADETITPITQTFAYLNGVSDKHGRGFLGFMQRYVYGPGSRKTTISYDPLTRQTLPLGSRYVYPYAMRPKTIRVDVDTPQGPNSHARTEETTTYTPAVWQSNGTYVVLPTAVNTYVQDCLPSSPLGTCGGTPRILGYQMATLTHDAYANITNSTVKYYNGSSTLLQTDTRVATYDTADTTNWLVSIPGVVIPNSTQTSTVGSETVIRGVSRTPDMTVNAITGLKVGVLKSIETEPLGTTAVRRRQTFNRNPTTGQLTSIDDREFATNTTRTTSFDYLDGADGIYLARTTNALGQSSKVWRHPGYGLVVEVNDVNNLASSASYDTFGRPLSQTGISGATTTFMYESGTNSSGIDVYIKPENLATRQGFVHYDSWQREQSWLTPIDATNSLFERIRFDDFGRVIEKESASTASWTQLNLHTTTYDDLGRRLSSCKRTGGDGLIACKTNVYDGLKTTSTDEAGLVTTSTSDSRGRPSIQSAELSTGTSNATYTYGAFDLLRKEQTDATSQTDLAYDVLGRLTTVTRTLPGIRMTEYNAFGDVTKTYKKTSAGGTVEPVTYGRDALGRLTSVTATGVARNLYWDKTAGGVTQSNSIGNLVDVYDGVNGANSKVHFNYNGVGLLHDQSWTMSLFGAAAQSYGTASFTYDPQGRLATLTYPKNLPGTYTAFTAQYTYDPYMGDVKSIADSADPSNPLWQVTERSKWGSAATEALRSSGGTAITKTNSYYPFTGALQTATLGAATLTNYYYRNDLPSGQVWIGVGSTWVTGWDYDNLRRLTTWRPDGSFGTPDVTYGYDSDGNLNSRSWIGETVTYSLLGTAGRKATVVVNGNVRTDNYAADSWGRINDTPSSTLTYNAVDEVTNVIEKTNGSLSDKIIRSGHGERLATTYGTVSSGPYLLTLLGDLYEFKYTNSTTREERYRLRAGGKLYGDVVRSTATGPKTSTFYLTDNVGSVLAEASNTGVVTARMRRDPYGNAIVNVRNPFLPSDPSGANPDGTSRLGFGGHERDPNWGLLDMKARFYAPALGRFIAPDSIVPNAFDRRDYNPFAYAGNNPVAMNDPTGRGPERNPTPDPFNPLPLPPPDGGTGGPGSDPPGSGSCTDHCSPRQSNHTPPPVNPYVAATGTVPTSALTTTNAANTVNNELRSRGPTDGNGGDARTPTQVQIDEAMKIGESNAERYRRIRDFYGIGRHPWLAGVETIRVGTQPELRGTEYDLRGLNAKTIINWDKLGTDQAVRDVAVSLATDKDNMNDLDLAVVLKHEYDGHGMAAILGTHPLPTKSGDPVITVRLPGSLVEYTPSQLLFEAGQNLKDARFSRSIGNDVGSVRRLENARVMLEAYKEWNQNR